jgi:hypothetical protein
MILSAMAFAVAVQRCPQPDTALPRALAGWTRTARSLDTGHAVVVTRRGARVGATMRIRKAGTFGIAIDRSGWIDVAPEHGRPLRMASERAGPRCSTIAKIVRYRLRPGSYRVTVGRLRADRVRLMLVHGD